MTSLRFVLVVAILLAITSAVLTPNAMAGDIIPVPWAQMARVAGQFSAHIECPGGESWGEWPFDAADQIFRRDPRNSILGYGVLVPGGGRKTEEPPYYKFAIYLGYRSGAATMPMMLLEKELPEVVGSGYVYAQYVSDPPRVRFLRINGSWPMSHETDYGALMENILARLEVRGLAVCFGPVGGLSTAYDTASDKVIVNLGAFTTEDVFVENARLRGCPNDLPLQSNILAYWGRVAMTGEILRGRTVSPRGEEVTYPWGFPGDLSDSSQHSNNDLEFVRSRGMNPASIEFFFHAQPHSSP